MRATEFERDLCVPLLMVLMVAQSSIQCAALSPLAGQRWVRTPPVRIVIGSTADWAKVMFDDDQDGQNRNGIRISSIIEYGWLIGGDDDQIIVGRKLPWIDILYNTTVEKSGDIVSFYKGTDDFNYTRMFVNMILEVDATLSTGYVWLMLAGQGVTSFELANLEKGYIFWRETLTGRGHTSHVRRDIMMDSFFRTWDVSTYTVAALIAATLLALFILSPLKGVIKSTGSKPRRVDEPEESLLS